MRFRKKLYSVESNNLYRVKRFLSDTYADIAFFKRTSNPELRVVISELSKYLSINSKELYRTTEGRFFAKKIKDLLVFAKKLEN